MKRPACCRYSLQPRGIAWGGGRGAIALGTHRDPPFCPACHRGSLCPGAQPGLAATSLVSLLNGRTASIRGSRLPRATSAPQGSAHIHPDLLAGCLPMNHLFISHFPTHFSVTSRCAKCWIQFQSGFVALRRQSNSILFNCTNPSLRYALKFLLQNSDTEQTLCIHINLAPAGALLAGDPLGHGPPPQNLFTIAPKHF